MSQRQPRRDAGLVGAPPGLAGLEAAVDGDPAGGIEQRRIAEAWPHLLDRRSGRQVGVTDRAGGLVEADDPQRHRLDAVAFHVQDRTAARGSCSKAR